MTVSACSFPRVVATAAALLLVAGCEKPEQILKTLQTEISAYAANPSEEAATKIDGDFQRLEEQIAKLREAGKVAEAERFAQQESVLQTQYAAARLTASLLKAKGAAAEIGEAFRKAGEAFGEALKGPQDEGE